VTFPRLIPVVTLVAGAAVKTSKFTNPKYVGDPSNTVALFSSFEAEELIVLDISDSFKESRTSQEVLTQIIENASMPIAFGGGIKTFDDAKKYFDLGFDKVVIRSSLYDSHVVKEISDNYGAQAVTGCLDYRWDPSRSKEIEVNEVVVSLDEISTLLMKLQKTGLGEIIIHNIGGDGSRTGLEMSPLLESAVNILDIPVVALGGCSNAQNAADFIKQSRCHSVAASTTFLFRPTRDAVLVNYPKIEDWHKNFEKR
jgi:cyclase